MIHDETTTEIEIPGKKLPPSNIVRVDFAQKVSVAPSSSPFIQPNQPIPMPRQITWWERLDKGTPWVLRLLAAVMVLALSLLIF